MSRRKVIIYLLLFVFLIPSFGRIVALIQRNNIHIAHAASYEGLGTEKSPYLIKGIDQYSQMIEDINSGSESYYSILIDINASELSITTTIKSNYATINYNFHAITNLNQPIVEYNFGTIKNLIIESPFISGYDYLVDTSHVKYRNTYDAQVNGYFRAAGAVACVNFGNIYYVGVVGDLNDYDLFGTANVEIEGPRYSAVGGIVGIQAGGIIRGCYAYNLVFSARPGNQGYRINAAGGIAGYICGGKIYECITHNNEYIIKDNGNLLAPGIAAIQSSQTADTWLGYASYLTGGIFGFASMPFDDKEFAMITAANNDLDSGMYLYNEAYDVSWCYSDHGAKETDTAYSYKGVKVVYTMDYNSYPGELNVDLYSDNKVYDLCIGGIWFAVGYNNNYMNFTKNYATYAYEPTGTNELVLDGTKTPAQQLEEPLALFTENGWVIPTDSNKGDYDGFPYFKHIEKTQTATLNAYWIDDTGEYPEQSSVTIGLSNYGSGWESNSVLNSYSIASSTIKITDDSNISYTLVGWVWADNEGDPPANYSVYSRNGTTCSYIWTTENDIEDVGTTIISYSSGGYSLADYSFEDGKSSTLAAVYKVVTCKVTFNYKTIDKVSALPTISLEEGNNTLSYGSSTDLEVKDGYVDFQLSNTSRYYFIYWEMYYESALIKTSLSNTAKISIGNISTASYESISKDIALGNSPEYTIDFYVIPRITITLKANGGTPTNDTSIYTIPSGVGKGSDFIFTSNYEVPSNQYEKSGSKCKGFYSKSDGGTQYLNADASALESLYAYTSSNWSAGITLYAQWATEDQKGITLSITHKSGGSQFATESAFYIYGELTADKLHGYSVSTSEYTYSSGSVASASFEGGTAADGATYITVSAIGITIKFSAVGDLTENLTCNITINWTKTETPEPTDADICYITITYKDTNDNSIPGYSDIVWHLYYKLSSDSSLPGTYANEMHANTTPITINTPTIDGYKYSTIVATGEVVEFIWDYEEGTTYFMSQTLTNMSGYSGAHYVTFTVTYVADEQEEPTPEENVCYIKVVYSGITKSSDTYTFKYLKALANDDENELGYNDYIFLSLTGYTVSGPDISGTDSDMANTFLDSIGSWYFKTKDEDSVKDITGTYSFTLTYTYEKVVTLNMTFNYTFSYEYKGETYQYSPSAKTETWEISAGTTKAIPTYSGYPITSATRNYSNTASVIRGYVNVSGLDVEIKNGIMAYAGNTYNVVIDCYGTLNVIEKDLNKNVTVTFTGIYYKGYTNENSDRAVTPTGGYTSGKYDSSKGLYEKSFSNSSVKVHGKASYLDVVGSTSDVLIEDSFEATAYTIPASVKTTLQNMSTVTQDGKQIKLLTKPNGYVYDPDSWMYGANNAITFGTKTESSTLANALLTGKFNIYQKWQYATYTISVNKNAYTNLGIIEYTACSSLDLKSLADEKDTTGYEIEAWYISSIDEGYAGEGYKIIYSTNTVEGTDAKWRAPDNTYLIEKIPSQFMYGNFAIQPLYSDNSDKTLTFDFGITQKQYITGYSNTNVYYDDVEEKKATAYSLDAPTEDIVTYSVTTNLNSIVNLKDLLNEVYKTTPKFYQSGNVKYYLVGWSGTNNKGQKTLAEIDTLLDQIYLYNEGVVPGNVVTDSDGKIYAVWAPLYEIRIGLEEHDGSYTSLYYGQDLIQEGNIRSATATGWQDKDAYYYSIFYAKTLGKTEGFKIFFDMNTTIGDTPTCNGYSLSYKNNERITKLEDVSLKALSGYRIFVNSGASGATNYYINSSGNGTTTTQTKYAIFDISGNYTCVNFDSLINILIQKNVGTIVNIQPIWEDVKFYVTVNGDSNITDCSKISGYKNTFTVSAKGNFDIWPADSNTNTTTYNYWYFDYLTDKSGGKVFSQTINGKSTNLPIGQDFYTKILGYNQGIEKLYNISVAEIETDKLGLSLEFNAHYIGAVYALKVNNIDRNGNTLSASTLNISTENNPSIAWASMETVLQPSIVSNGKTYTYYNSTTVFAVLKKYTYLTIDGVKCGIDNSEAFDEYPYKLYLVQSNYYLTLQDKTDSNGREFDESLLKTNAKLSSIYYDLDFYDYGRYVTASTTYPHTCYDISEISIEQVENIKQFTSDSGYSNDLYKVSYDNGKCSFKYQGTAYNLYARWAQKTYYVDLSVQFDGLDTDSAYLMAKVTNVGTTKYYAYTLVKDLLTGEKEYCLYSIGSTDSTIFNSGSIYNTYNYGASTANNKLKTGLTKLEDVEYLEVPSNSRITIYVYDQGKDSNFDNMLGYRLKNVVNKNPYENKEHTFITNLENYIVYSLDLATNECTYTDTFIDPTDWYVKSTGYETTFNFEIVDLNKKLQTKDVISLSVNLEKINYYLNGVMDNADAGRISYQHGSDSSYSQKEFKIENIKLGDNIWIKFNSTLGYELKGWSFKNIYGYINAHTTDSLIFTDGRNSSTQAIDSYFLRQYAYRNATAPYSVLRDQSLGTVSPTTGLITFTLSAMIYNLVDNDLLEGIYISNTSRPLKLDSASTVHVGETYNLIFDLTNNESYCCYQNGGIDYAILKMYVADKVSKPAITAEYDFPVTSLPKFELKLDSETLANLVQFNAGTPITEENRTIYIYINVAPIITINSVSDEQLQANTSSVDVKNGERVLKAGEVVLASALDGEILSKKNTQYAYVGQEVIFSINSLNSKYYSGANIIVQQGEDTQEYILKSTEPQKIILNKDAVVNIQFVPESYDYTVRFLYNGAEYETSAFGNIVNLADVNIISIEPVVRILDENGNTRGSTFFYGDTLELLFDESFFNPDFVVDGELKDYGYTVKINGVIKYQNSDSKYTTTLTGRTNIVIEILDTANAVLVQRNIQDSGELIGVSKSGVTKQVGNNAETFALISGDDLTIYVKEATGFELVGYTYDGIDQELVTTDVTEGDYAGYTMFTIISDYQSSLSGTYTIVFNLIDMPVQLVYDVEGEENSNAGKGYFASKNSANIHDNIDISNNTGTTANEGFKFVGYSFGKSFALGGEIIAEGSYQANVVLIDYASVITECDNKVIIYVNFINLYTITISNKGNDFEQTKLVLYENQEELFKTNSRVNLPYSKTEIDGSNYSNKEYKLAVQNNSGLDLYYIELYLNGSLIENTAAGYSVISESLNNNVCSLEYTFKLNDVANKEYHFEISYMPEKLINNIKEYKIDTTNDLNAYLLDGTLPTGSSHQILDDEISSSINLSSYSSMSRVTFICDNRYLVNRYNVLHKLKVELNPNSDYTIYQIWVNDEKVFDSETVVKTFEKGITLAKNTDIVILYRAIYMVES